MEGLTWLGSFIRWMASFVPTWVQIDRNELGIKHKGWLKRKSVVLQPGVRWYWPAFSQIEGPFRTVQQPLTTSTINVMDSDEVSVAARGFATWRIIDAEQFCVENEDAPAILDDLVCAAIRDVITRSTIKEIQGNSRKTTNNALLREVKELTMDLGVEILLVRLTTFTKARMLCVMGDEAPTVVEDEPEAVE